MANINVYDKAFDYDTLKRRYAAASVEKKHAAKARVLREYGERRARRFTEAKAVAQKNALADRLDSIAAFMQSESTHLAIASIILAGFVIWIGHMFYVHYAESIEQDLVRKCASNQLSHASNVICYDGHGYIHTLNPDGTARKAALDWTVNEKLLRQAEFANRVAELKQVD